MLGFEEPRILAHEEPGPEPASDGIADAVACDSSEEREEDEQREAEQALAGKKAGREQEAVAWKEEAQQHPGLAEHDGGDAEVAGSLDQRAHIHTQHGPERYRPITSLVASR